MSSENRIIVRLNTFSCIFNNLINSASATLLATYYYWTLPLEVSALHHPHYLAILIQASYKAAELRRSALSTALGRPTCLLYLWDMVNIRRNCSPKQSFGLRLILPMWLWRLAFLFVWIWVGWYVWSLVVFGSLSYYFHYIISPLHK